MFLFGLLSLSPSADAVTYGYVYDITEMTDIAHNVISGKVISVVPRMENGKIVSAITLQINHNYVGNKRNNITIDILGGTYNGIEMQVPGAPKFSVGDETLAFIEDGKIVGFGQGAYSIKDNDHAIRNINADIKGEVSLINPQIDLPDETEARSCLEVKVWNDYGDDWSMRSVEVDHMSEGEFKAYPITLMQGLEYKFLSCTDEKATSVSISIYDEEGNIVETVTEEGREVLLEIHAEETEQVYLTVEATTDGEVKQVGTSVGILYR
jgi:hypothetical protein